MKTLMMVAWLTSATNYAMNESGGSFVVHTRVLVLKDLAESLTWKVLIIVICMTDAKTSVKTTR